MDFSFIQITDHHLGQSESTLLRGFSPAYSLRAVLRHIAATLESQVDFIVSTGDLVNSPSEASYDTLGKILDIKGQAAEAPGPLLATLAGDQKLPMYFLPGNHDDRNYFFRSLFSKTPPQPLMNVAFTYQEIQFICVDWGPEVKAVAHPEMLQFLAGALKTGQPSIILMHHACVPVGSRWLDDFIADEVDRFREIMAGQNVLGMICGHTHVTFEQSFENIPVFGLRSTAFQFALVDHPLYCLLPPHYRLFTVEDGVLTAQVHEVRI